MSTQRTGFLRHSSSAVGGLDRSLRYQLGRLWASNAHGTSDMRLGKQQLRLQRLISHDLRLDWRLQTGMLGLPNQDHNMRGVDIQILRPLGKGMADMAQRSDSRLTTCKQSPGHSSCVAYRLHKDNARVQKCMLSSAVKFTMQGVELTCSLHDITRGISTSGRRIVLRQAIQDRSHGLDLRLGKELRRVRLDHPLHQLPPLPE